MTFFEDYPTHICDLPQKRTTDKTEYALKIVSKLKDSRRRIFPEYPQKHVILTELPAGKLLKCSCGSHWETIGPQGLTCWELVHPARYMIQNRKKGFENLSSR